VSFAGSKSFRASPELVVVDIRPDSEHERVWIAGSIHLTGTALASAGYLREKPVLLVGTGPDAGDAEATCRRLEKGGFKSVRALLGGIAAWSRAGGKLEGEVSAPAHLNHASADAFARDAARAHWLLIDVGAPPSRGLELPVQRLAIPISHGEASFRSEVAAAIRGQGASSPARLVALTGATDSEVEAARLALAPLDLADPFVFAVDGGRAALESAFERQRMIAAAAPGRTEGAVCAR
jgi:rhodanese-related sulfurtransferase